MTSTCAVVLEALLIVSNALLVVLLAINTCTHEEETNDLEFVFLQRCIGKEACAVTIANSNFGQDPCPNKLKRLTVEAVCSPSSRG